MSGSSQSGSKRGGKSKLPIPANSSFYALGTTSSTSSVSNVSNVSKVGIKREANSRDLFTPSTKKSFTTHQAIEQWEDNAIEIDVHSLLRKLLLDGSSETKCVSYLCGAVKQLRAARSKPDSTLYLSLMYLAKIKRNYFCNDLVVEALCSLLKREPGASLKPKTNLLLPVLAANLLLSAFHDETTWHISFVRVFIEDSLGERTWVDHEACKGFVDNIMTAFNTKLPPKNLMSQDILSNLNAPSNSSIPKPSNESASSSPSHILIVEDSLDETLNLGLVGSELKEKIGEDILVFPRYQSNQENVIDYVTEVITEQLNRRQVPSEINRNVLKLLISTSGIQSIRLQAAQKLEIWLQNPKLSKSAQDLLLAVTYNCTKDDNDVISALVKLRLKTKVLINHLTICIKELLNQNEDNTMKIMVLMRNTIANEFSSSRGSNNLQIMAVIFQYSPEKAIKCFGLLIQEFLIKEDFLRNIRTLLREIVRTLRHDHINLCSLVATLTQENSQFVHIDSQETLNRVFNSITDIITLCIFLSISPSVKEASSSSKSMKKDILRQYQASVAEIQRLSIYWMQKVVLKTFKPERNEFIHCLNKCLFMESAEHYYNKDNWPPETDRNFMFRISTEVTVLEDSLFRLLKMGLSKDYPVQPTDIIDLTDALIKRAAALFDGDLSSPTLPIKREGIFDLLLKSASYRIPENITLPTGYDPPSMAISDWYWKVWIQMLIITSHNSNEFGLLAWKSYPTLGIMIEMSITNNFEYPPPTRQNEDLKNREMQITALEKQQILQLEGYLAAASSKRQITEASSLLLSKLTAFDPTGTPREPPKTILDQLKSLNTPLRLGYLLCQSRNPDFLLEIIQRQQKQTISSANITTGMSSMQWLNDLIEMNCDNLSTLPVECLGEFTLRFINDEENPAIFDSKQYIHEKAKRKERSKRFYKLLSHFQEFFASDGNASKQLIEYFMKRLISQQASCRRLANLALSLVLSYDNNFDENEPVTKKQVPTEQWLLVNLPKIGNFEIIRPIACSCLCDALLVEGDPDAICIYLNFLSDYSDDARVINEVSKLILERGILMKHINKDENLRNIFLSSCLKLYYNYNEKLSCINIVPTSLEYQDYVRVSWKDGTGGNMPITIIHGLIALLTYDPPIASKELHYKLMKRWFFPIPNLSLLENGKELIFLPDWMKIRLIRSNIEELVDFAVRDSDIHQLINFIQSFGIPIKSMEKLLCTLDSASNVDPENVKASLFGSALEFIQQVIEVQFQRGVKSGHKFSRMVESSLVAIKSTS